jgi:hypothetical protein
VDNHFLSTATAAAAVEGWVKEKYGVATIL